MSQLKLLFVLFFRNFRLKCMSMRLALLHESKNEDVSHKIHIYIASAQLSFKTTSLNNTTSLTFNFDDSCVKTEQISIWAEMLLENTFSAFRPSNWTLRFWMNVAAETHICVVFSQLSSKVYVHEVGSASCIKKWRCLAQNTHFYSVRRTVVQIDAPKPKKRGCLAQNTHLYRVRRTVVQIDAPKPKKWGCLAQNTHLYRVRRTVVQIDASEQPNLIVYSIMMTVVSPCPQTLEMDLDIGYVSNNHHFVVA